MSDIAFCFSDQVTDISATLPPGYFVGKKRIIGNTEYTYVQADDTITQYQAVTTDHAANTSGKKVTPCGAATDDFFGAAQVAVTDEYYFWCATRGSMTCKIATAATAGLQLACSATAGVLATPADTDVAHIRAKAMEAGAATNAAKLIYVY